MPTPAGVPVAITSPGYSVMPREQVSISVGMSKIRSVVRRVLAQLAVDPAAHPRVGAVELVGGDDPRPHRAEGVEGLAQVPLLVAHLHVARGHVVDDGVAEHVAHRVGAAMSRPPLPMTTASSAS
jgi:hypothetical protein